jgi:drug/metabolite transporter (DMT)-like permease
MTKHLNADERRGAFYSFLSVFLFAGNVLWLRAISLHVPAVDGWIATLMRGIMGLIVLLLVYGGGRGLQLTHLFNRPLLIVRGVLGGAGITILYITVLNLGAGRAIILNLTYPLFGAVLAALFMKEALTRRSIFCLLLGFLGLLLFLGQSLHASAINSYDLLALLGAFCAALVVLLLRHLRHTEHPWTIYSSQCFYGLLLALPLSAPKMSAIPPTSWMALAGASVIVAIGQLLLTNGFRHLSVAKGSGIQMLLPPVTAAGGILLFGESYSLLEASGAVLTLLATWFLLNSPPPALIPESEHQ